MSGLEPSWIASANSAETPFPLNNLPYGVFSVGDEPPRCGVAIGDQVLDLQLLEARGIISLGPQKVLDQAVWNPVMALGPQVWAALRARLKALLAEGGDETLRGDATLQKEALVAANTATLHMPFTVAEFTDFYAGRHHAQNIGTMFRGPENALPPNWLHIPIGYNGRASSVVISGTDVRRPWGQLKGPNDTAPRFAPSRRFDFELEM
ncbi:MAG: fumarylacetoacetase, partial [Pseudomonadota bacterium]